LAKLTTPSDEYKAWAPSHNLLPSHSPAEKSMAAYGNQMHNKSLNPSSPQHKGPPKSHYILLLLMPVQALFTSFFIDFLVILFLAAWQTSIVFLRLKVCTDNNSTPGKFTFYRMEIAVLSIDNRPKNRF